MGNVLLDFPLLCDYFGEEDLGDGLLCGLVSSRIFNAPFIDGSWHDVGEGRGG